MTERRYQVFVKGNFIDYFLDQLLEHEKHKLEKDHMT